MYFNGRQFPLFIKGIVEKQTGHCPEWGLRLLSYDGDYVFCVQCAKS